VASTALRWSGRNIGLTALLFRATIAAWEAVCACSRSPSSSCRRRRRWAWRSTAASPAASTSTTSKYTLLETLLGFIVGSALGFFLGTAVAMNRYVEFFFYPYIIMFQSLPKVALAPLIVVWFGARADSKVINAALVAFFPLLVNTMVGLKSADEDRVEPHALAGGQRSADLLDAAPAQRAAVRHGRPRRGHDLRAHRRHRGRVRRGPARARHAHPVDELHMDVSGQSRSCSSCRWSASS